MTSLDGINGRSIQMLLRGESDSKQSDEIQATYLWRFSSFACAIFGTWGSSPLLRVMIVFYCQYILFKWVRTGDTLTISSWTTSLIRTGWSIFALKMTYHQQSLRNFPSTSFRQFSISLRILAGLCAPQDQLFFAYYDNIVFCDYTTFTTYDNYASHRNVIMSVSVKQRLVS